MRQVGRKFEGKTHGRKVREWTGKSRREEAAESDEQEGTQETRETKQKEGAGS